jgi:hypothetical protein
MTMEDGGGREARDAMEDRERRIYFDITGEAPSVISCSVLPHVSTRPDKRLYQIRMNRTSVVIRHSLVHAMTCRGNVRAFASDASSAYAGKEWRKKQLQKLEKKFRTSDPLTIESEEDLQPMWKSMESRVKNRRPRTAEELGGRTGRTNIKRTDEELWLQEGLYDNRRQEKMDDVAEEKTDKPN